MSPSIQRVASGQPGAEVSGLDARKLSNADIVALTAALAEYGVLVFRGQVLEPPELIEFGRKFGELECATREQFWHPEHREIYVISNVMRDSKPIGNPNDGFGWHTDLIYMERPTAYTILYGMETPAEGAATLFCGTFDAYSTLPDARKADFADCRISASHRRLYAGRLTTEQSDRHPDVTHPLVRTHPISGKKFLYFGRPEVASIDGKSEAESRELLETLIALSTRPDSIYAHQWKPRDLVIWDNRGLLHAATPYDKARFRRTIYRVSTLGERTS